MTFFRSQTSLPAAASAKAASLHPPSSILHPRFVPTILRLPGSRLLKRIALCCAVTASLLLAVNSSHAADQTWSGGASGNNTGWTSTGNWVGGAVPGSASTTTNTDIATIPATGTHTPNDAIGISGTTFFLGAINFTSTADRAIGASGTTGVPFTLQLNGATVNGVSNTILRSSSTGTLTIQSNIGQSTPNTLVLALGNTTNNIINIDSSGGINIAVAITGTSKNLTLNGNSTGILTFSGGAANSYSGLTTVNSGTLLLNKTAGIDAIDGGGVKINSGGTLKWAASNQVGVTSAVNLNGGTLNLNGFSEGAAGTTGIGALTLTTTSTIDFGVGSSSIIQFSGVTAQTQGQVLQIISWDGVPITGGSGDRLLFAGSSSSFTALYDQTEVSFNGLLGYQIAEFGTYYEVTAMPEPSTWIGGALALLAVGLMTRKRFIKKAETLKA